MGAAGRAPPFLDPCMFPARSAAGKGRLRSSSNLPPGLQPPCAQPALIRSGPGRSIHVEDTGEIRGMPHGVVWRVVNSTFRW